MTTIEWTHPPGFRGDSWNPVVGCHIVSPGCTNCYAMKMARRIELMSKGRQKPTHYAGTTMVVKGNAVWTDKIAKAPENTWTSPLRRTSPICWFVNSMGDLFHEDVPRNWIDRALAIMALTQHHRYIILTKRSDRMRQYFAAPLSTSEGAADRIGWAAGEILEEWKGHIPGAPWSVVSGLKHGPTPPTATIPRPHVWPLPNVWLGVSVEDQTRANERIFDLMNTRAAVRLVSAEPMLGPVDFTGIRIAKGEVVGEAFGPGINKVALNVNALRGSKGLSLPGIDWIIVGGESGPGRRPFDPDWARSIRDDCALAKVPLFMKQWDKRQPKRRVTSLVRART